MRTAGALLLLYGQFVSRLTRLTTTCIEQHGPDTYLRLEATPVLLPPRLATLVCSQRDAPPAKLTLHPAPRPARCSPATRPHAPCTPAAMTRRLRQHGIEPQQARNAALTAWAADLPTRSPGQPPRRPHPDRHQLGPPHTPGLDQLHRSPRHHPREYRTDRISALHQYWNRAHDRKPADQPGTGRRRQRSTTPVVDDHRRWHTAAPRPSRACPIADRTGRNGRDQRDHAGPAGAAAQDAVPRTYPRPPCPRTRRGPRIHNVAAGQLTTTRGLPGRRPENLASEFRDTEWRRTESSGTRRQ